MAEALVNKAKLAEQAERYDDMAKVTVLVLTVMSDYLAVVGGRRLSRRRGGV